MPSQRTQSGYQREKRTCGPSVRNMSQVLSKNGQRFFLFYLIGTSSALRGFAPLPHPPLFDIVRLTEHPSPTKDDSQPRKPAYTTASTSQPEPPPPTQTKRPLSNPTVAPTRSLSELQGLHLGGTKQESEDVPMKDISDDNPGDQPRKRPAIGDGISAGSGSPLPFRDSESPPPRRSKARPTSAPYGSTSDVEVRRQDSFEDTQRPHVGKKTLWTPDQDSPLTRASFDPNNIASVHTQKSRNQAMQPKSRKTLQTPPQPIGGLRQPAQSAMNPTPSAIFGRAFTQTSQIQPKDETFDIVMQPETRPISQEQLVAEVKGSKCLGVIHLLLCPIY